MWTRFELLLPEGLLLRLQRLTAHETGRGRTASPRDELRPELKASRELP
jgi:hypothetical protein